MTGQSGVPSDVQPPGERSGRRTPIAALDGLRGIGCLLVVLLHAYTLIPSPEMEQIGPLLGLFKSGSLGVTLFFVIGGFFVTRKLLDEIDTHGTVIVDRFWMRRLVRIGSQLYLFLIVLWIVSLFDRWDIWTSQQHQQSLLSAATFTLNWSLIDDPSGHRSDIGHLWYLSVEQQFYLVWIFVLAWIGRFRTLLVSVLSVAVVALFVWRFHVLDVQGGWIAELRTATRVDGLLLGALGALALPWLRHARRIANAVTFPCLVMLGALVLYSTELSPFAFLQTQGILFSLGSAVLVVGIVVAENPDGLAERLLSLGPIVLLGRVSFPVYLWHFPVFWASSRWAFTIDWPYRLVGSVLVVAGIAFVTHRFIERPVDRWLDTVRTTRPEGGRQVVPAA